MEGKNLEKNNEDILKPDFFVSGLTASGKDTVTNFLKEYFDYRKMRIAKTIKQIIMEKNDITFDELEELKRNNPEWREKHHEESAYLTKESSLVRTKQIIKRTAIDYECVTNPDKQIIICDVRCNDEAGILFENEAIGIFLSRTTDEYKNAEHFTEKNMFTNGELIGLLKEFGETNKFIIIFNGSKNIEEKFMTDFKNEFGNELNSDLITLQFFDREPNADELLNKIDEIVSKIIIEENE